MAYNNCVLVAVVLIGAFICSGNILTIIAVCKSPALRTTPNMYVISLAVTDLIMGGIVLPSYILVDFRWVKEILKTDKYLCLFRFMPFAVSAGCSVMNMVLIAVDRCMYIVYPLHYERLVTERRAKITITLIWVASVLMPAQLFLDNTWEPNDDCSIHSVLSMEYIVINRCAGLFACCVAILVIYIFIIRVARQQQCLVRRCVGEKKRRLGDDIKLIKVFGLVFGIFFVCWFPLMIVLPLPYFGIEVPTVITTVCIMLSSMNSGMNFIVYVIFNKDFRREIQKMIRRRPSNNVIGLQVKPEVKETVVMQNM